MNISEKDRAAAMRAVLQTVALDRYRRRRFRVGETVQDSKGIVSTIAHVNHSARTITLEGQTTAIAWDTVRWVNKTRMAHVHATLDKLPKKA